MTEVIALEVDTTSTKPRNGSTLINIVLDETGSMHSCWDSTISSFNEYIASQKNVEGECSVSLYTFSDAAGFGLHGREDQKRIRIIYENLPVKDVDNLTRDSYQPEGGTNLYDAIGSTIRNVESQLGGMDSVPEVLVVIITDGDENCSREYRLNDIKRLIAEKEKEGWTFVYLGANQDAWKVGASFGLSQGQTMTYNTVDMSGTMSVLADATTVYRGLRSGGVESAGTIARNFFGPKAGE